MLGLSFLNSLFLFALAATALPIIIHILNRRRLRRVPFSSLEFIVETSRRRMSKINLRRWLVLLLRTLAILCVVLAFARPAIRAGMAMFIPGDVPKYVVICLDTSGSMSAERERGTAFTRAQELAGQVVDETGKADVLNVVTFASRSEALFDSGTRNKQIVKNVVKGLEPTAERTATANAIELAADLIRHSEFSTGEVYVISDFCEADSVAVPDLDDGVRVVLMPVAEEAVDNVSIDRVFTPRKLIRPGEVIRIGVALTNHSRIQAANFPLELFVEGSRKAEQVVNLSPASTANVTFSMSMNEWGSYECRVSKNRDRLPTDDDRYFLIEVSKKIPVTLVRGRRYAGDEEEKRAGSYFYVEKALNPRGSGEGEFSVTAIDENDVTLAALKNRSVVVWTDPFSMDGRRLGILQRFVHEGGTMLVFLSADRRSLWRDESFAHYLGMERAQSKEKPGGEQFASYEQAHPALSLFNEEELELLSRARVRRYVSAAGVAPDSVLVYFGGGDPAMWELRRGQGRVIVVATAPDTPSGDLPLSPMFLPLIHTTVSYLASAEAAEAHRENYVGSDLFFDLPTPFADAGALYAVNDTGERRRALVYEGPQGEPRAMVSRPRVVGFYTLMADSTQLGRAAVNMDTRESNLNPAPLEREQIGQASVVSTTGDVAANLQRDRQGREVYAFFLMLAIGALVLESILGRKA